MMFQYAVTVLRHFVNLQFSEPKPIFNYGYGAKLSEDGSYLGNVKG